MVQYVKSITKVYDAIYNIYGAIYNIPLTKEIKRCIDLVDEIHGWIFVARVVMVRELL